MCSPSTIVAVFLLLLLLVLLCCRAWFLPMGSSERTTNMRNNDMYICVYIYTLKLVSPTGLSVKQTTFSETRSTQWFRPSRNIMLAVLCFCLCLCWFPSLGLLLFLFLLLRVYPRFPVVCFERGFSQWVCPPCICISCVHTVVIQYALFNSIYIRIDLI